MASRAAGLVKIKDLRSFRKAVKSMTKDLVKDGYEKGDVEDIIIQWVQQMF